MALKIFSKDMELGCGPRRRLNPTETYEQLIYEFNENQRNLRKIMAAMKETWPHLPHEDQKFFHWKGPPIDIRPLIEVYEAKERKPCTES